MRQHQEYNPWTDGNTLQLSSGIWKNGTYQSKACDSILTNSINSPPLSPSNTATRPILKNSSIKSFKSSESLKNDDEDVSKSWMRRSRRVSFEDEEQHHPLAPFSYSKTPVSPLQLKFVSSSVSYDGSTTHSSKPRPQRTRQMSDNSFYSRICHPAG